jgi:hypothetical protein
MILLALTSMKGFGGPPTIDCDGILRRKVLSVYFLEALQFISCTIIGLIFKSEFSMALDAPGLNKGARRIIFKNPDNNSLMVVSFISFFSLAEMDLLVGSILMIFPL